MRIAVVLAVALSPLLAFGQPKELPDVLKPDQDLVILADAGGFEVAKILPRGTFAGPFNAYKDEENPLGIREGGSFYSFSTRQHSYNKTPEVLLENGYIGVGGFAGLNYGFMTDLGDVPLEAVDFESPAASFLHAYRPPTLHDEIRAEQKRAHRFSQDGVNFQSRLSAKLGHTYLVRAISMDASDKLVVFKVLRIDETGAISIGWRSLKDFDKPTYLYESDDSLRARVAQVVREKGLSVQFSVSSGHVNFRDVPRHRASELSNAVYPFRPKGISFTEQGKGIP